MEDKSKYVANIKSLHKLKKDSSGKLLITSSQKIYYYRSEIGEIGSTIYEVKHEPNVDMQKVRPKILLTKPTTEYSLSNEDELKNFLLDNELMSQVAHDQYINPRYLLNILDGVYPDTIENIPIFLKNRTVFKDVTYIGHYLDKSDIINKSNISLNLIGSKVNLCFNRYSKDDVYTVCKMRVHFNNYSELKLSLSELNCFIGSVNLYLKYS